MLGVLVKSVHSWEEEGARRGWGEGEEKVRRRCGEVEKEVNQRRWRW